VAATQNESGARRSAEATASQRQPGGPLGPGTHGQQLASPKHAVLRPPRKTTTHWRAEATASQPASQPRHAGSVAPATQKNCQLIDNA